MPSTPPVALEPHPLEEQHRNTPYPDLDLDDQSEHKSYWWVWLLILGVIGYGCYRLYVFENGKKELMANPKAMAVPSRPIPIVAASAHSGNMPVYLDGLGTVTAFNTATVKPREDGLLTAVLFHEGQFVHKGDLLATLDARPFQVALDQAKGTLAEAKGTLAKDEASLRDAQVNYQRDQELFKDQIIAKQQLDTQLATADEVRGSIQADKASIAAAEAAIAAANLNLSYTRITAPISGKIGLRLVDQGNMVHATDATGLAIITQLQPISVLFTIPEDQLPAVLKKLNAKAKLRVEAFDRDQKVKLADGTLLTVDNEIDPTTGTSRLKAVFPNPDLTLFPNQFVNARLWLDTQRNVLIVPAVAIQRGPTGTFVYVVQSDSTVAVRPVKVGLTEGDNVSIDEGIRPGDQVVVDGAEKLVDGMKVAVTTENADTRRGQ